MEKKLGKNNRVYIEKMKRKKNIYRHWLCIKKDFHWQKNKKYCHWRNEINFISIAIGRKIISVKKEKKENIKENNRNAERSEGEETMHCVRRSRRNICRT